MDTRNGEASTEVPAIDLAERVVVVGGERHTLTPLEVQVLGLLIEADGSPVARTTLERDVWGLSERVRSEAVPVAMRRLRSKVGERLQTVRGFGWSLQLPSRPTALAPVPRPTLPWLDRPALRGRLQQALRGGARQLAVVGPPGIGKTRLVVESIDQAVWVALEDTVATEARLLDALSQVLGTQRSDRGVLVEALAEAAPELLVFDGVQALEAGAVDACRGLSRSAVVIVVCREAPLAGGWTVLPVPPLEAAEALALFELRAGRAPDEAEREALTEHCDGVPAAIELVAGRSWMALGGIGRSGDPLEAAIVEGWSRLDESLRGHLSFLVGLGATTSMADLEGLPVLVAVPELVRRGLVQSVGDGALRVLAPVREVCLRQPGTEEQVQAARTLLVERAEAFAARMPREPRAALDGLQAGLPGLDRVIHEADAVLGARAALALCALASLRGPTTGHRRRIERVLPDERLPGPLRDALQVERGFLWHAERPGHPDTLAAIEGIETSRAHRLRGLTDEVHGDRAAALEHYVRAVEAAGPDTYGGLLVRARMATVRRGLGATHEEAWAELEAVRGTCEALGLYGVLPEVLRYQAILAMRHGEDHQALAFAAEALERVEAAGLTRQVVDAWNTFAMCLMEVDLTQAEQAFERASVLGRRMGEATTVFAVNRAYCLCCLDRPEQALALLQPVHAHAPVVRPLVDLLCVACHRRQGASLEALRARASLDPEALGRVFSPLEGFGESLVELVESIGSPLDPAIEARAAGFARDPSAGVMRGLLAYVRGLTA